MHGSEPEQIPARATQALGRCAEASEGTEVARYARGGVPVQRRKARRNALVSEKPRRAARSVIVSSPCTKASIARSRSTSSRIRRCEVLSARRSPRRWGCTHRQPVGQLVGGHPRPVRAPLHDDPDLSGGRGGVLMRIEQDPGCLAEEVFEIGFGPDHGSRERLSVKRHAYFVPPTPSPNECTQSGTGRLCGLCR